jgi:predicted nucleotidyltransferase
MPQSIRIIEVRREPVPESIYHLPHHGLDSMTQEIHDPEGNTVPGASTVDVEDRDLESMIALMIPVLKEHGVKRAGVFGSFVRGEATGNSDLDLVVELPEGASLLDLAGIKVDLEDLFGLRVDVTTYNALHPSLRDQILREERVIV